MKNQYFGDRRDYLKYSLIRALGCELSVAVCWLLTYDDRIGEGRKTGYLCKPDDWCRYDPKVYNFLRKHVMERCERRVDVLEEDGLLGEKCRFFSPKVPSDSLGRYEYFDRFVEFAKGTDLVFFDPDIGIEPTTSKGPQYVHWYELALCFSRGHSLLIYQHFGRQKHDQFVESQAEALARLGNADRVFAFYDDAVAFFLVAQHDHTESLDRAKAKVEDRRHRWHGSPVETRVFEVPQRRPGAG